MTAPQGPPDLGHEEQDRLRQLVWFDIATACTAVAVISATYALVVRSGWLLVLCGLVVACGITMAAGLRPLARGQLEATIGWMAAANWGAALAATAIATFAWPLMMLAALLPAVLAAPYVSGARLRAYVAASVTVSIVVVAVGLFQDFSGFTDSLPSWVPPTIAFLFTPFLAGMVVVTALQHSSRLRAALGTTLEVNVALAASRARLVAATDRERCRVERDLHDGAQQRLVALGLGLRRAQDLCHADPDRAATVLEALRAEVRAAQQELRELAHGVYPPVLTQHGLAEALAAAADRCPAPVEVRAGGIGRFPPHLEATVYFCCVEALQNVVKHAGEGVRAAVEVSAPAGALTFTVRDDGHGFAGKPTEGTGLQNLRDRVGAVGGQLEVRSTPGTGTVVSGHLPC